jgi:hypothetical protein
VFKNFPQPRRTRCAAQLIRKKYDFRRILSKVFGEHKLIWALSAKIKSQSKTNEFLITFSGLYKEGPGIMSVKELVEKL